MKTERTKNEEEEGKNASHKFTRSKNVGRGEKRAKKMPGQKDMGPKFLLRKDDGTGGKKMARKLINSSP